MLTRIALIACVALLFGACEKTNHENIDKWASSKKGPGKLKKAFLDNGLDADLSAHAAVNMIKKGRDQEVKTELDNMPSTRRDEVVGKMAARLWESARVEGEKSMPVPSQVQAKDALVMVRKYANPATRTQIDGYLIDWLATPAFEGRAQTGAVLGVTIVRMVGPSAAKKLMRVADGIIAAPGQEASKNKIGDELLVALAATGDPEAVKYVLNIARMLDRGDKTLPDRAMGALYRVYVDPGGLIELQQPAALIPNLDDLVTIAKDERMGNGANSAVALIRVVGSPACIAPLVSMVAHPHPHPSFRYFGPDHALKCGGVAAIKQVVLAMPDIAYEQKRLEGSVILAISNMSPRDAVLKELRDLLAEKSRMARWVAIETLAYMKATEDAGRIAGVKGSERLVGFWGDGGGGGKPEPTLAQRAKELSSALK